MKAERASAQLVGIAYFDLVEPPCCRTTSSTLTNLLFYWREELGQIKPWAEMIHIATMVSISDLA